MKNILIIPSNYITNIESRFLYKIKNVAKQFIKADYKEFMEGIRAHLLCAENYHYDGFAEINEVNTFILGEYYPEYIMEEIPKFSNYPSMHNCKLKKSISINNVLEDIKIFDYIIFGSRSGNYIKKILDLAKKKNIPRILLDHFDDTQIYSSKNINYNLSKRFKYKEDFDLMFKHDLPTNCDLDYVYPICPMPIRADNYYKITNKEELSKNIDISFSGRVGHNNATDREYFQDILKGYENSKFVNIALKAKSYKAVDKDKVSSLKSYLDMIASSKIALSPFGKVWDSTRHSELAIYNCLPIIPQPNCKLSDGIEVNDENSINYELNFDEKVGKSKIIKQDIIKDKISYFLKHDEQRNKIAKNWSDMINKHNSFKSRAKFILDKSKAHF